MMSFIIRPVLRQCSYITAWYACAEICTDAGDAPRYIHAITEKKYLNGFKDPSRKASPAFILEHHSPDDVATAMIRNGRQKQPFYIFSMDEAYRRIKHFRDLMPRIKMFYAMKANDNEMLLKLAVALELGFDCASPGEIYKIRKLNVNPKSIIYAMPCKTYEEMVYARNSGVRHTTFDTSYQLKMLKSSWPEVKLLIRIRIDGDSKIKLGEKFGCDFEREAPSLLDEAASLGLDVVGVAFHVGSMCYSPEIFTVALQQTKALFDHEMRAGRQMNIVDIGGGFLADRTDRIDQAAEFINTSLEELFPDPSVQIIAEPGRYLSESAFKVFCSIMAVRRVVRNNVPVNMIYMNDGSYGTMRFLESWHKIRKFQRSAEIEPDLNDETILWGPTCDSLDRVMPDRQIKLPPCTLDDWLVIDNHGAYTITFSTRFSSVEIPPVRPVVSKALWNCIKQSTVFEATDFVLNPNISAPLASTLPPVLPQGEIEYPHTPTLIV